MLRLKSLPSYCSAAFFSLVASAVFAAPPPLSFGNGNDSVLSGRASSDLAGASISNATSPSLQPLATLGGKFATPIKLGNYLYVPNGAIVTAWNYAAPWQPQEEGDTRSQPVDGVITNIASYKSYLYVGWNSGVSSGIAVYSIANPGRPELIKQLENTSDGVTYGYVTGVAAVDGYLYVFDRDNGMFVNALTDPANPHCVGTSDDTVGSVVSTAGDRMMASGLTLGFSNMLSVYDVSRPDTPIQITNDSLDGIANYLVQFAWPRAVGFGQDGSVNAYMLPASGGPATLIGTGSSSNAMRSGFMTNAAAYLVGDDGIDVWRLSAPVRQISRVAFDNGWAALASYAKGQIAWVGDSEDYLSAFTLERPNAPKLVSRVTIIGGAFPTDAALVGNSLLLLQQNYGVRVAQTDNFLPLARLDVDLPKINAARDFEEMSVSGSRAYLSAWGYGLIIADFSDPTRPRELGRFSAPLFGRIASQGRYVYLGKNTNGGEILSIDVENPAQPVQLGSTAVDAGILRLQSQGTRLFAATAGQSDAAGGLRVFDVSNPAKPIELGAYSKNCESATDLVLSGDGNTVYLRCNTGLHIIDVSRPSKPVRIGFYPSEESASTASVALSAGRLYMSGDARLDELDVRNPRAPVLLSTRRLPFDAARLRITADGRLYAFMGSGGVQVFKLPAN